MYCLSIFFLLLFLITNFSHYYPLLVICRVRGSLLGLISGKLQKTAIEPLVFQIKQATILTHSVFLESLL